MFKSWYYRVVSNLVHDHFRYAIQNHSARETLKELREVESKSRHQALNNIERGELRNALAKALAGLEIKHREAFLLKEVHGLSHLEVAGNVLDLPEGTVWSRIFHARPATAGMFSGTRLAAFDALLFFNTILNTLPRPGSLSNSICPPCAFTAPPHDRKPQPDTAGLARTPLVHADKNGRRLRSRCSGRDAGAGVAYSPARPRCRARARRFSPA